jgi:hypothetical protein
MGETYFLQAAFRATTFFPFTLFFQYPCGVVGVGGVVERLTHNFVLGFTINFRCTIQNYLQTIELIFIDSLPLLPAVHC